MTTAAPQATAAGATRTDQLTHGSLELPWTRWLFRSRQAGVLWLIVRLWLGWQWVSAGWGKLTAAGDGNWFSHATGLRGFIAGANSTYDHRAQAHGHPQVSYAWYVHLLNAVGAHAQLFSRVVTLSELAVGIGLLLGCLTGVAAAGGVALNIMYITGGSAGPNGIFILLGVLLIAAWRVAGYLGADYFLLPRPRLRPSLLADWRNHRTLRMIRIFPERTVVSASGKRLRPGRHPGRPGGASARVAAVPGSEGGEGTVAGVWKASVRSPNVCRRQALMLGSVTPVTRSRNRSTDVWSEAPEYTLPAGGEDGGERGDGGSRRAPARERQPHAKS
jgi:thiosulfate dehydrogenase (quinone) large subunit